MSEEPPILSDKTLGDIKSELSADPNVVRFAFKRAMATTKQPVYFFDLLIYELGTAERTPGTTDEVDKRQYRLYVEDFGNDYKKEDFSRICWDRKQRWKPSSSSTPSPPEPSFTDQLTAYLNNELADKRIQDWEFISAGDDKEVARLSVVGNDFKTRTKLAKRKEETFELVDYEELPSVTKS
jgi:hypothetical protein